jgi:hypothetical protein
MSASWYKLKDGSWGCKIRHEGLEGEKVTLTNKKGEATDVYLVKRVAKFDDAQLWSFSNEAPADGGPAFDEEPF